MERYGVGDEGDVDGFAVPSFESTGCDGVGDEGYVGGFSILSNYVSADFSTDVTSSERPHEYADELSSAWGSLAATDMAMELKLP